MRMKAMIKDATQVPAPTMKFPSWGCFKTIFFGSDASGLS